MPAASTGTSAPTPPKNQSSTIRLKFAAAIFLSLSLIGTAFFFDVAVREHFAAREKPGWKKTAYHRTASIISKQGDWPQLMLAGGLSLLIAWKLRRRDWVQIMAAACLASTATGLLANASRLTTGRVRPRDEINHGAGFHGPWKDGRLTIGQPGLNSYPSGHTATAFGFAVPIVLAQPVVGIPVLAGAAAIAWSRMALGAHHFSDVVTSIVLSAWVGWWILGWVRTRGGGFWVVLIGKMRKPDRGKNGLSP